MTITLADGTTEITLPGDLEWVDEWEWTKVKESVQYSLTGSLHIQSSVMQAGRPITLRGGSDYAWLDTTQMSALLAMANQNTTMTLTLADGRSFQVRFRYNETPINFQRVAPGIDKFCNIVLRFREV